MLQGMFYFVFPYGVSMAINIRVGNLLGAPHSRSSAAQGSMQAVARFNPQQLHFHSHSLHKAALGEVSRNSC